MGCGVGGVVHKREWTAAQVRMNFPTMKAFCRMGMASPWSGESRPSEAFTKRNVGWPALVNSLHDMAYQSP